MFDWTQRGTAETHSYRGFYDAGEHSPAHCAQCDRRIRHCYSMHDQHTKSFVIGTCCFHHYISTKAHEQLRAAQTLQEATKNAIVRDTRLYGALTTIQDRRKQWRRARREALTLIRKYQRQYGAWLPKELFDLRTEAIRIPSDYKRPAYALRWYATQTMKLVAMTQDADYILLYRSI